MAGFHQFLIFFMESINIGPVCIRGGWEGTGWGGWWQRLKELGVAMTSTCTHIIPLQGLDRHALTVGAISGCSPPLAPFHQSWVYMVGKEHSRKADQLTLASGGSEHA